MLANTQSNWGHLPESSYQRLWDLVGHIRQRTC